MLFSFQFSRSSVRHSLIIFLSCHLVYFNKSLLAALTQWLYSALAKTVNITEIDIVRHTCLQSFIVRHLIAY